MDFKPDRDRADSHFTIALLALLLIVPVVGALGVLGLTIASAWLGW